MDSLEKKRQIIENIFWDYAQISYRYGELKNQVIINRDSDSYLLMTVGWSTQKRVHYCLLHIDIIDGKIWIQRDGTEDGIAIELVMAGIPKDEIVLAFHPAEIRQHTEFAVT
jgi:XisI protein